MSNTFDPAPGENGHGERDNAAVESASTAGDLAAGAFDPASGLDLRPLGSDSASVPSLGATPLVPVESDRFVRTTTPTTANCDVLPAVPTSVSRDSARSVRAKVDPIGHWDSVVACPVVTGPQGESSPLINGAIHIFLSPGALMRQLGGPAGAQQHGLTVTRGRLLTLLDEGLKSGLECAGFWLYGLEEQLCFLPVAELEPLAETIETVLFLARASTSGISAEQAVKELSGRTFFHTGGWGSSGAIAGASTLPTDLLQLFVSPVSLLKSGHVGQVATVGLAEVGEILGERTGVVIEQGMGYALTIGRELLPEAEPAQES
ncbi:MAG: hypothetical protein QM705_08400 [Ancrocorticia sp.]